MKSALAYYQFESVAFLGSSRNVHGFQDSHTPFNSNYVIRVFSRFSKRWLIQIDE
jgi:hypothetical protein